MISETALASLRRLMELREKRDVAKVALANAEKEYRDAEADVHEALSEGPVDRLPNVDLGEPWGKVTFHAKKTHYGRVEDADAAHEYFAQRAMLDDMSDVKMVDKRINEEVRRALEEGTSLPPGLDFYTRDYVQITRTKG